MDDAHTPDYGHPHGWKFLLMAELRQVAIRRPWGPALMAVGGVHLTFFLICQTVYTAGVRSSWPSLLLWSSEIGAVLAVLRLVAGPGWFREAPVVGLIARVWITFLILSFNVASMNTLTGFSLDWFKPVWCTLASFGFATMAWLFGLRFLIPAFQMYFTGLLMVQFSEWNYLIHGLSWCAALQWIGWDLSQRRARLLSSSSPFPTTSGSDHNSRRDDPTGAAPMSFRTSGLAALGFCLVLGGTSSAPGQVAFVPNVSAFPNGVVFSTTPVVSADRRYVRMGVNPQFNALEGFNTYNVPAAVTGGGVGLRNVDVGMMPGMAYGMDGPVGSNGGYGYGYGYGTGFIASDSPDASAVLSGGMGMRVQDSRRSRFEPAPASKARSTRKTAKTRKVRTTR